MTRQRMFFLALLLLLTGSSVRADPAEERALQAIKQLRGKVSRRSEVVGEYVIDVVVGGDLALTKATDADLKRLSGLRRLRSLDLAHTGVTDWGLLELAAFEQLRSLTLRHTKVSDEGLKSLAGLDRLEDLNLSGLTITPTGMKALAALPRLRRLRLLHTKLTDAALKGLAALKQLQTLYLDGSRLTGPELRRAVGRGPESSGQDQELAGAEPGLHQGNGLAPLQRLRHLNLERTKVTAGGLRQLAVLLQLKSIRIDLWGTGSFELVELLQTRPHLEIVDTGVW
jgi:hypothetical protein